MYVQEIQLVIGTYFISFRLRNDVVSNASFSKLSILSVHDKNIFYISAIFGRFVCRFCI